MKRTVILVQPKVGCIDKIIYNASLPLSLLSISRFLIKKFNVEIIDQRIDKNWKKTLLSELKNNPLCVGLTCVIGVQIEHALEISRFVKKHSKVAVVWGGVHASTSPKQTLENQYIDYVVVGEGEKTFFELVHALKNKKPLNKIRGLCYKKGSKIYQNPPHDLLDLNRLPPLPYELVDINNYFSIILGKKTLPVESSRGCPHKCTYCFNNHFYGGSQRYLEPKKVVEIIKYLEKKYNVEHIRFIDVNFFSDFERCISIAELMIKEKCNVSWDAQSHINDFLRMTADNLKLLEKSNLKLVIFGVESGSQKILNLIKKGIKREKVISLNKNLCEYSIIPQYNFMYGFPFETHDDFKESINLSLDLLKNNKNAIITDFSLVFPYPKTELYDYYLKNGFKFYDSLEGWIDYDWTKIRKCRFFSKNKCKTFELIHYSSYFMDDKFKLYSNSKLIKTFAYFYKYIALFRLKYNFFYFPIELKLNDFYLKYIIK